MHFLLFNIIATSFAMELQKRPVANRWREMAKALPALTMYDGLPITQSQYCVMSFVNRSKIAYLKALHSAHPVDVLEQVAMPLNSAYDDLINGTWKKHNGEQTFALARLARGVLLQGQGNAHAAEYEFKEVERSAHNDPYEEPIMHAAACCRLLLNNQHDYALDELFELQKFLKTYPCWQQFTSHLRTMFIDAHHMPAIEKLALSGDVDAQFHILQDACAQAVTKKDVGAQCSQIKILVPYFESLLQHPKHTALAQAVTQYTAAVCAYERKQFSQASELLIELLDRSHDEVPLTHVNQLTHSLLEAVALQGDVRARCYVISHELQSTERKVRRSGIEHAEVIMQELMRGGKTSQIACFDDVATQLENLAWNNNSTACVLLAQWKCYQALGSEVSGNNVVKANELHQAVKRFAQRGLDGTHQQPQLLKNIITYADGVIALCDGNLEAAGQLFITLVGATELQHELDGKLRHRVGQLLRVLKEQGEWRARCWVNNVACVGDGKTISEQNAQSCVLLATEMLDGAPKELIEGAQGAQLYAHVRTLVHAGNKEASYPAGRFLFRIVHFQREQTGLDCQNVHLLMPAFRDACTASLAGVPGAKSFQDALTFYIKTMQNTQEGKHDLAVESALKLSGVDLPEPEKSLCLAFVRHQLTTSVSLKNNSACAWLISDLLARGNAEEIAGVLTFCETIFTEFAESDFEKTSAETWQSKLQPYKMHNLVAKLKEVHVAGKEPQLQAQVAGILSLCHLVQASVPYQFIEDNEQVDKEVLLRKALVYAKEAYALSCTDDNKDILGLCCLGLASFYVKNDRLIEEKEMLEEGVKLKHPHCMFIYALGELSTVPLDARVERFEFDAHIAMLHQAHALGSLHAGEVLAEHYFDGPGHPFECGYALDTDMEKAYNIANGIVKKPGVSCAQAARIVGYLDFCRAQRESKKIDARDLVTNSIQLLVHSVQLGCEQAYAHLVEICKSRFCNPAEMRFIITFIEKKAVDRVPVALCAMGSILVENPQHRVKAIEYFNEAARLSGGTFGHYELIELYVSDPQRYMQGADLFMVADHCVALLNAHIDIRSFGSKAVEYFGKVLLFLQEFKGDQEHTQKAERHYATLVEGFRRMGIEVSKVMMPEAEISPAVAVTEMKVVSAVPMQEESAKPVALNETFLQRLTDIDHAFEDMSSEGAQRIMQDTASCDALKAASQEDHALSCYLLSKYRLYKAEHDSLILETFDTRKACYQQAVDVARRALQAEPENKRYARQFTQACTRVCAFYLNCVTVVGCDQELLTETMKFLEPLVTTQEIPGIAPTDIKKIVRGASKCVHALACQGCVPALRLYVETYLQSQSAEQQNAALEALYRCAFEYDELRGESLRATGIVDVLATHHEYIKQLADTQNNGHAAVALIYCLGFQQKVKIDQPDMVTEAALQETLRAVHFYSGKAKNSGCPAGVYLWYKNMLFGSQQISQDEFRQALKALEKLANTEEIAAELLIELCVAPVALPCGHQTTADKTRAKKLATRLKDRSVVALRVLTRLAQEDKEFTKAILYKLEIVERTKKLPPQALLELGQNCAVVKVYPREVLQYLESKKVEGNVEAIQALGGIAGRQKQFERAVALLTQAIELGSPFEAAAHFELAYVYVDADWSLRNVAKAVEHVEIAIHQMAAQGADVAFAADDMQPFAMLLIKLMLKSLMTQDLVLRQEAGKALEKVVDLMQVHRYYNQDSVEYSLILAMMQFMIGSDYWILRRYLVNALALLKESKSRTVDLEYIGNVVSIILSRLQADALAQEKEGNDKRVAQLTGNIQDLIALVKKDKITYYMVLPVAAVGKK